MTYIVSTEVVNPYGICLGEDQEFNGEDYGPYVTYRAAFHAGLRFKAIEFWTYHGTHAPSGAEQGTHIFRVDIDTLIKDYVRQTYNLSNDIEIDIELGLGWSAYTRGDSKELNKLFPRNLKH